MTIPNKTLRQQIENWCVHFTGIGNRKCKADIEYDDFRPPKAKAFCLPCLRDDGEEYQCPHRRWPTEEEIRTQLDALAAAEKRMLASMNLVRKIKHEHWGKDWQGEEKCPVCGGKLHIRHSAYNGHTAGKCETEGCLAWME